MSDEKENGKNSEANNRTDASVEQENLPEVIATSNQIVSNTNIPTQIKNPWETLKQFTPARIGLGRTGHSLTTAAHLDFQLAHAQARDAVYFPFDADAVAEEAKGSGLEVIQVESAAQNRNVFLHQPDLGRQLSPLSKQQLSQFVQNQNLSGTPTSSSALSNSLETPEVLTSEYRYNLVVVLGEGLSSEAIHQHAIPVLKLILEKISLQGDWKIGPIVVAKQSRVALGDEIGYLLGAEQVAIFIGERPGLTSPDSLGIYLTYAPGPGKLESERNCISNIRLEGLQYEDAATLLFQLLQQARRYKLSGIELPKIQPE